MTLRKGKHYPPLTVEVRWGLQAPQSAGKLLALLEQNSHCLIHYRIKYEQTVLDIKKAVAQKSGVPVEKQQLFWHSKELTATYDTKTLLEMNLHTGFSLTPGYDLVGGSCRDDFYLACSTIAGGLRQLYFHSRSWRPFPGQTSSVSSRAGPVLWGHVQPACWLHIVQTETPDYWPPVEQTPEGLRIVPQVA